MSATENEDAHAAPEDDDTPGGIVLAVIAATVLLGVLMVAWAGVLLRADREDLGIVPPPDPIRAPRAIGFLEQTLVLEDRHGLRMREQARADLDTYGWVDRETGIARIPVDRAIDLYVAGLRPGPEEAP